MYKQHYEKFADGTIKNIENEIPFEIPDSWCWANGYQLFLPMLHTKPNGIKFQYVDIDSVDNKTHYIPQIKLLDTNKAPSRASRKIDAGDTVFSMVRPYLENIAFIDERFQNAIASTGFFVCKTILIDKKYIYYLMVSSYTIKGLNCFMKGDNSPSINADNIFKFLFPLPPLSEQQRIVAKIEELFAQVDKIEEEKQSLLKLIDRTKDKVLDLAMKGKLVKQDLNDEPASVLLEKIFEEKKQLAKEGKIKLSKDEFLQPKISDDNDYYEQFVEPKLILKYPKVDNWVKLKLNQICANISIKEYQIKTSSIKQNGKFPVVSQAENLIDGFCNKNKPINLVPCVIFGDHTKVVKYINFPFIVGADGTKCLYPYINSRFFYYLIRYYSLFIKNRGYARHYSYFATFNFYIPSFKQQEEIVISIEKLLFKLEQIKDSL